MVFIFMSCWSWCLFAVIAIYCFLNRKSVYLSRRLLKFGCALVCMNIMYRVWFPGHGRWWYVPGSNLLIFFWFLESIWLVLCFFRWTLTPLSRWYDIWVWKENARTRGVWWNYTVLATFCLFVFCHWNYCSLVDIFLKTEVIGKLYCVRSADENVGGSGGSVVDIFWKTQEIGKLYYVRSANETRVVR